MAVDPAMVDAMLGTFRDLLTGAKAAGSTGPDVDEMAAALASMEALSQEMNDVGEFSAKLAGGGYYQRFTDAYTRVMTAAAGGGTTGAPATIPDDETLLAQSLQAYEGSLQQLRSMADQEDAIEVLEQLLAGGAGRPRGAAGGRRVAADAQPPSRLSTLSTLRGLTPYSRW